MRNTYSPWAELSQLDLELVWRPLPPRRLGEYYRDSGLIVLNPAMPRRQARSVLCHELRHHEFGDVGVACSKAEARQELRADKTASRLLIDIHDLGDALVTHDHHQGAAAVELRVSMLMLATRMRHLHPSEVHFLRRRCHVE